MICTEAGDALAENARSALARSGVTRDALRGILPALESLAAERHLWTAERFPDPEESERQARYLIREDPDGSFALYLNVMRPGKRIPPHNHTTWACIAAVWGTEHNTIYKRVDGGTGVGPARLRMVEEIALKPGRGIALLPDDIHAVEIRGESMIRHLHFYGRALETLTDRLTFDLEAGTAKPMPIGVQTRR